MARGPRNLHVATNGIGLTQFGGAALIEQFFQRIGLQGAISQHVRFAQRNNRYSVSECLKALIYPLVLGLGRIETTEPLRHNGVFHYLAGLPGYPDATTLRRFLDRFARRGRNSLVKLHDAWRAPMLGEPSQAGFDLDTTVLTVYGRQEGAEVGYNPQKRGRPSYLPLLCFEGNTQDCWEGSYHPGDTHVSTITIPLLEHAFPKLPESIREVRVRADAAFFDHEIVRFIEGKRAFYAIVARLTPPLKRRLAGLRYRRVSPGVWAGEFQYCPQGWPGPRRFVVIRRPVPEEPSAQLTLFQMGGYSYQALVTNLSFAAPQPLAVLQSPRAGGIDHPRIEVRLRPGEDSDEGLASQRGVLPDCLAGVQPAELVQTSLCPSASAAGHPAASSPALVRGTGPVGATGPGSHSASCAELPLGCGLHGHTATHWTTAVAVLDLSERGVPDGVTALAEAQKSSFFTPDSGLTSNLRPTQFAIRMGPEASTLSMMTASPCSNTAR